MKYFMMFMSVVILVVGAVAIVFLLANNDQLPRSATDIRREIDIRRIETSDVIPAPSSAPVERPVSIENNFDTRETPGTFREPANQGASGQDPLSAPEPMESAEPMR